MSNARPVYGAGIVLPYSNEKKTREAENYRAVFLRGICFTHIPHDFGLKFRLFLFRKNIEVRL